MASWGADQTSDTQATREALERTLAIAEDLIRKGRTEEGLELVRRVNDVMEQAFRRSAGVITGPQP
jgi:hypothetical protein